MKNIIALLPVILFSCNSQQKDTIDHVHPATDTAMTMHAAKAEKLYQDVKFDSKYDLSCGMPLTAGLTDTVHYKGKVYGFCSPGCREDFVKNADSLVAKAK